MTASMRLRHAYPGLPYTTLLDVTQLVAIKAASVNPSDLKDIAGTMEGNTLLRGPGPGLRWYGRRRSATWEGAGVQGTGAISDSSGMGQTSAPDRRATTAGRGEGPRRGRGRRTCVEQSQRPRSSRSPGPWCDRVVRRRLRLPAAQHHALVVLPEEGSGWRLAAHLPEARTPINRQPSFLRLHRWRFHSSRSRFRAGPS